MEKRIKNTSKSFLKKLFGKDDVDALIVSEKGVKVQMVKTGEKPFSYEKINASK